MRGHSFINKCIFIIEIFPVFSLKIPFRCTSGLLLVKQEFFLSFLGAVSWPPSLSGPQTWPERKLLNVPNFTRNNVFDEHSSQPKRFDRSTSSFSSSLCTVNLSSRVRRRTFFFLFFSCANTIFTSYHTTYMIWHPATFFTSPKMKNQIEASPFWHSERAPTLIVEALPARDRTALPGSDVYKVVWKMNIMKL